MAKYSVQFHLLGILRHEQYRALQQRLVYELSGQDDGRIVVLLAEHPRSISVGRRGSRGFVRLSNAELRSRGIDMHWTSRGGGCILHAPGQLAIYPFVPLSWHQWTVGELLRRLRHGLESTLAENRIRTQQVPNLPGLWGRSGQLAAFGVAVRSWISCHGAFLNVNPPMTDFAFVDVIDPRQSEANQKTTMGSMLAERQRAVTMQQVRASLIPQLASAFGTDRYYLLTGHPLLPLPRTLNQRNHHRAS